MLCGVLLTTDCLAGSYTGELYSEQSKFYSTVNFILNCCGHQFVQF